MASDSQKIQAHKFQAPKGTRDFYPQDMAVRRYIEGVWRQVSINHGFDEIEGPMFEHLDLYTHKSGPGIVSEIFQVFSGKDEAEVAQIRGGAAAPYALRPEFTPTLARMVAAKAAELPRPIKWFAIPQHFRAERPQRGRLREFGQWNVDFIGEESPKADAEVIATAVAALERLGLTPQDVRIKINDRFLIDEAMVSIELPKENWNEAYALLDRREKLSEEEFAKQALGIGIPKAQIQHLKLFLALKGSLSSHELEKWHKEARRAESVSVMVSDRFGSLATKLDARGVADWCELDMSIVRGLAYYTGMVFEIHEAGGKERAIAGGGRYDKLIESFGGASLPACGFGMGDVVLGNILRDKGLLKDEIIYEPIRPDAFVISNGDEIAEKTLPQLVATLRREGFHVRHSYKATRNVGKLLGDAGKCRARFAVILGKELADNCVALKNLDTGVQDADPVPVTDLPQRLRTRDNPQ